MNPQAKLLLDSVSGSGSATNGGTFTSANIDTLGVDYVTIDISATTQSASTQAGSPSLIKLQESETTVVTSFADVVGFRGASLVCTVTDFMIGIGKTAGGTGPGGGNCYKFNVDCRARKRYLTVVASPTTTQTFQVTANGFGVCPAPNTAAKAGVLNLVEG